MSATRPRDDADESADALTRDQDQTGATAESTAEEVAPAKEIGGRDGPEPTRFGDWEKNGRCIDF